MKYLPGFHQLKGTRHITFSEHIINECVRGARGNGRIVPSQSSLAAVTLGP